MSLCLRTLLAHFLFLAATAARNNTGSGYYELQYAKPLIGVGNFFIPINDVDLTASMDYAAINTTHYPYLEQLRQAVYNYWTSYEYDTTPPVAEQLAHLGELNEQYKNATKDMEFNYFASLNFTLNNISAVDAEMNFNSSSGWYYNKDLPNADVGWAYSDHLRVAFNRMVFRIRAAYMGVGRTVGCARWISDVMAEKSEWQRMTSGMATALMALVPTILAFGHLYTPRSSEAYTTSLWVGFTTSLYTFGLPTASISAVSSEHQFAISSFGIAAIHTIRRWGRLKAAHEDGHNEAKDSTLSRDDLSCSNASVLPLPFHERIEEMRSRICDWEDRWHLWYGPAFVVVAAQVTMFYLAIVPLFMGAGMPRFLFSCHRAITGHYLGVSALVNAVVRFLRWQASGHEHVKAYAVSERTLAELRRPGGLLSVDMAQSHSTATCLPPLYPSMLLWLRKWLSAYALPTNVTRSRGTFRYIAWRLQALLSPSKFFDFVKSGFVRKPHSQKLRSARRWRPVHILVYLSETGRSPFITLFTGFIECALLLVLTFFFTAQWGGNLVITAVGISFLLVFTTLGRALGFIYVWLSSRLFGLTVIECGSKEEVRGVLRILCSMQGVLVRVNGATYFEGYRLDVCDGYRKFQKAYEKGDLDDSPSHNLDGKLGDVETSYDSSAAHPKDDPDADSEEDVITPMEATRGTVQHIGYERV